MSLEQQITTTLVAECNDFVSRSSAFKCKRAALQAYAWDSWESSIEGCQDFIDNHYFRDRAATVEVFNDNARSKDIYETMMKMLEPSYDSPHYVIANALVHTRQLILSEARPADCKAFLENAELYTLEYIGNARKLVENGGADLKSGSGGSGEIGHATQDQLEIAIMEEALFGAAMEMWRGDEQKAIRLVVKAVNAALQLYSAETVAEFEAAKASAEPALKKRKM